MGRRRHRTAELYIVEVPPVSDDGLSGLADQWSGLDGGDDVAHRGAIE